MSFVVLGHRGMGPTSNLEEITPDVLPENSLAAFGECFDLGADGIEFDVHMTRDRRLAVIHDDELNKKVAGACRASRDLGLTSDYHLAGLGLLDIGNGHKTPSLEDVLDLVVERNADYKARTGRNLTIDVELKGPDTALPTFEAIVPYLDEGLLNVEDFIFNSFFWDRLSELKLYCPEFKIMPAIKTRDLFGPDNVTMPGYKVLPGATYCSQGLKRLAAFHSDVGCHAFDCVIFDLRPELIDFCEEQGVGLFTSTSYESVKASEIEEPLRLMVSAKERLPFTGFRADHVTETNNMLAQIAKAKTLPQKKKQSLMTYSCN